MSKPVTRRVVLGGVGGALVGGALVSLDAFALPGTGPSARPSPAVAGTVLWRLGNADPGAGSSDEFRDYLPADPEQVTVPADWASRTSWDTVLSKGLKASVNPAMTIRYELASVPANGAEFQVKITNAHRSIPQLAVFSNRTMVGMIQIAGVTGAAHSVYPYVKTYRLYIPKEFLKAGDNILRLAASRSFSGTGTEDKHLWWTWDHLQLVALQAPATEPVHGRYFHLGTMLAQGGFGYNQDAIRHLPGMLEWLGIAYSGNVMRCGFWSDLGPSTAWRQHGLAYLQKLAEYNMQVLGDHLNGRQYPLTTDRIRMHITDATGYEGRSNTRLLEIEVRGPDGVNLAPSATVSVDSTDGTNTKDKAVDGIRNSNDSRWMSENTPEPHWIELSWDSPKEITNVKVWSGNMLGADWQIKAFTIQNWDGSAWVDIPGTSMRENSKDGALGQSNTITFTPLNADGTLVQWSRDSIDNYLETYGDYIQYYGVDNEPGLFNTSKAACMAIARYVRESAATRAPHLKVVAPGWAYWPRHGVQGGCRNSPEPRACGDPDGWARNPDHRREVEELCDLTGGHSYGPSYASGRGASFVENLLTYGPITDGLPKEMMVSETGNVNSHVDDPAYGTTQRNAASFDRIMRGHVGYADHVMHHAAFFSNYQLFDPNFDWPTHDPEDTMAHSFGPNQQTRVDIYRRLALAYATHGAPLTYRYLNASTLEDRKIYTRAVNTATLAPLPGNGATSDKVLINVVNFDDRRLTVAMRVTMPSRGTWSGNRYGRGDVYNAARTTFSRYANPDIYLVLTLTPGEAVQYILARG